MIQGLFCRAGWWVEDAGVPVAMGYHTNKRSFNKPPKQLKEAYKKLLIENQETAPGCEGGIFPASKEDMPTTITTG